MNIKRVLSRDNTLTAVLSSGNTLNGSLNISTENSVNIYDGEYTVTPTTTQQILSTKQKLLIEDVTVNSIPYYEVSNTSGGETVYIGKEV